MFRMAPLVYWPDLVQLAREFLVTGDKLEPAELRVLAEDLSRGLVGMDAMLRGLVGHRAVRIGPDVHALFEGLAVCRFSREEPGAWPAGQQWTHIQDRVRVTCDECRHVLDVAARMISPSGFSRG